VNFCKKCFVITIFFNAALYSKNPQTWVRVNKRSTIYVRVEQDLEQGSGPKDVGLDAYLVINKLLLFSLKIYSYNYM